VEKHGKKTAAKRNPVKTELGGEGVGSCRDRESPERKKIGEAPTELNHANKL